jgi:plastocyanin
MGEWAIVPERRAIRPGRTTLVISNRGKVAHGFEIKAESGRGRDGDKRLEVESGIVAPGRTVRLAVTLPEGVYEFECWVADHDERGMKGTLAVRGDAPRLPARAPQAPSTAGAAVRIEAFAYQPSTLTVSRGQTVTWVNRDGAAHTVTDARGGFASKRLARGGRYSRRFDRAGRYAYLCALHPGMRGAVTVKP